MMLNRARPHVLAAFVGLSACVSAGAATVQVRVEHGDGLHPCPPGTVITLERNGPAVPFGRFFTVAYVGDTFVMTALQRNRLPGSNVVYGLDVYRGDVPIAARSEPRCDPAGGTGCKPDTSLAFVRWLDFPTDPQVPVVVALPPVPTLQVRRECGLSFLPCGTVFTLERNGPAMAFSDTSPYSIAYVNDTFVMTALEPNEVAPGLPYGLDVYRGDVPIVTRMSPRCDPSVWAGCTPDTAVAFVPWYSFPTDPLVPRVVPVPPVDTAAAAGL